MIISLVVAASTNNAIGKDNKLLWCLPNDMKYFKNVTWGMTVIMGRKTFESLGKALKGRKNIVITRQPGWKAEGVIVVSSLEDAITAAKETDAKEIMVIGGGEIFKIAFEEANRVYMTRVKAELEGDTFFPVIDPKDWRLASHDDHKADEKNVYDYTFEIWEKK
jgi:dihydrofolate reductase